MDGWLLITQNNVLMKPIQITGKIQHTMLHKIFLVASPPNTFIIKVHTKNHNVQKQCNLS